jgi:UDP-glucuronate 4-epimerase
VDGVIRCVDEVAVPHPEWDSDRPDPGTSRAPYRLYNIGNNSPVELMDFIGALERCLGLEAKKNMLPLQPGDVPDTYADVDSLAEDVGYRPSTPIEEGIEKFVSWYKAYYEIK